MKRATSILFAVILAATLTICTAKAAHADTRTRFGPAAVEGFYTGKGCP